MIMAFDVDGTLTPSRASMDADFHAWWISNMSLRRYILVTGSDYVKTLEQVGEKVLLLAERVFCCAGNSVWRHGKEVHRNQWQPEPALRKTLDWLEGTSAYPERCGNHIEERPGMINFSTIGRNCSREQRANYHAWDQQHGERCNIAAKITHMFPELSCQIGGEISVDIYPRGNDKSQVRRWYPDEEMVFFGDGMLPGQNDWALAEVLTPPSRCYAVQSWTDTYRYLQEIVK